MAAKKKKPAAKKPGGTKKPAAKKPAAKAGDVEAQLAAIDPELAGTNPDQPVATLAALATRTAKLGATEAAKLKALPGFQAWWLEHLDPAVAVLEGAEAEWATVRASGRAGVSPARVKAAEKLKSDLFASARYVLRADATSQQRLDEIAEGTGVADTAQDLQGLADMVEKHPAAFAADPDLPADAAKQARAIAAEIVAGTDPTQGTAAQERRNRAFWVVSEATHEVREGLKFLWKKQPQKLAQLGTTYAAQLMRGVRHRQKKTSTAPVASGQGGPAPITETK